MPKIEPFDKFYDDYEEWFEKNHFVYLSELEAVRKVLPKDLSNLKSVEIGVGTGRFALPFGIRLGIEPSEKMRRIAKSRGIEVIDAYAEKLPFISNLFDVVLMITTVCFLDNVERAFGEVYRVLKPNGMFVVGFVDRDSYVGRIYHAKKESHRFYRYATFYSTQEVLSLLSASGFRDFKIFQTVFKPLDEIVAIEPVKEGYGEGAFVVIGALR